MEAGFSLRYVLMCDDVRVEDNGKGLIVGLYQDSLILFGRPDKFVGPLAFLLVGDLSTERSVSLTTWIENPSGERSAESDFGEVGPAGPGQNPAQVVWRLAPWNSGSLGKFKLHLTQDGQDTVVYEFEVKHPS